MVAAGSTVNWSNRWVGSQFTVATLPAPLAAMKRTRNWLKNDPAVLAVNVIVPALLSDTTAFVLRFAAVCWDRMTGFAGFDLSTGSTVM